MPDYVWNNGACTVMLDMRELDKLISEEPSRASKIVRATAFQVESEAKNRAPVDTGALKNSIYTNAVGHYGAARMPHIFKTLNPTRKHRISKKVIARSKKWASRKYVFLPFPASAYEAIVGPSVNYGIYVEYGTYRMAARPYLKPAVEVARRQYAERWKELFI